MELTAAGPIELSVPPCEPSFRCIERCVNTTSEGESALPESHGRADIF